VVGVWAIADVLIWALLIVATGCSHRAVSTSVGVYDSSVEFPSPEPIAPDSLVPSPEAVVSPPSAAPVYSGPEAPRATLSAVLNAGGSRFQQCVDTAVLQGGIGGKLELGWVIVTGVVGSVHIVADTTGNPLVGQCFSTVVSGLKFAPNLTAQVAAFPWSFATE
jgi:hypothetical protein